MCLSVVLEGARDCADAETRTSNYIIYACTESLQLDWLSVGN